MLSTNDYFYPSLLPIQELGKGVVSEESGVGVHYILTIDLTGEPYTQVIEEEREILFSLADQLPEHQFYFQGFMKDIIPVDLFLGCSQKLGRACSKIFIGGLEVL